MAYHEPKTPEELEEELARTRIPKTGEILGIVSAMMGAGKLTVECDDGNTRLCRIPGKIRKRIWVRVGDLVIVEPWKVQSNERGDIVWRYTNTQAEWLKRKGYLKKLSLG
ncbi:MAG: translation initiation factor eIF-1A [Candidatus Aenigmatarchaeota archaeon]|nr:translation initiation factor eIF-1A [Candidatus Aenigmarchaeota archaeon]